MFSKLKGDLSDFNLFPVVLLWGVHVLYSIKHVSSSLYSNVSQLLAENITAYIFKFTLCSLE